MQPVRFVHDDPQARGVRLRLPLVMLAFVSIVPTSAFAQTTSGTTSGKQSAFVRYADLVTIPPSPPEIASVTLQKGKKRRNLVVDVTVSYFNVSELTNPLFSVEVNDVVVAPLNWVFTCPANEQCLHSMTWWVDLDELEAQNPGQIIAQPLHIELLLSSEVPFPSTMSGIIAQMGARLQPK